MGSVVISCYCSLFFYHYRFCFVFASYLISTSTLFMTRNVITHVLLRSMFNNTIGLVAFQPSGRWLCSSRCSVNPSIVAMELKDSYDKEGSILGAASQMSQAANTSIGSKQSSRSRRAGTIDEALLGVPQFEKGRDLQRCRASSRAPRGLECAT